MNKEAANRYLKDLSMYVININCALKGIKSNIIADLSYVEVKRIVITTNNIASLSDLQEIKKYIKNSFSTEVDQIFFLRLPQSKIYLKIVGILFISKHSNIQILSDKVESILKANHIFNDIIFVSKPKIIKISPKSDIVIICINIWDTQNGSNVKKIINRHFNIGSFIAMVRGANMNPEVLQCKNCWKWGHMAGICCIQGAKCVKCNGPHLTSHHCHFAWCCKANDKLNSPRQRPRRVNHALIHSSVSTAKAIIKLIQLNVLPGSTTLTKNSTSKSILNFRNPGRIQFVQL